MTTTSIAKKILKEYIDENNLLSSHLDANRNLHHSTVPMGYKIPHGLVICSIWEYDQSFLSIKMFERALDALIEQSKSMDISLDFIIVINNGGSNCITTREDLGSRLPSLIKEKLPHHLMEIAETIPPQATLNFNLPWPLHSDLSFRCVDDKRRSGKVIVVKQPHHPSNRGKINALRDVTSFLRDQIVKHGYYADFVYQMDAETILKYRDSSLKREASPFCELYSFFIQNNYTAVGTRDRFVIFDPMNGSPLSKPIGTLQIGWEIVNSKRQLISLSGGAIMAKMSSYVAAITQLSIKFPSLIVEDLAYTRLLQTFCARQNLTTDHVIALHPDIEHVNRTPLSANKAFTQIETWVKQSNAVDSYLPGFEFVPMNSFKMSFLIFMRRIREIEAFGLSSILRFIQDMLCMHTAIRITYTRECSDIRQLILNDKLN